MSTELQERNGIPKVPIVCQDESILGVIARAAADPSCDVDKMQALLNMQERIMAKQAEMEFHSAMCAAQEEMQPIVRDAQNDHNKARYARLETIDKKIRPVYTRHGFSLSFNSEAEGDSITVTCSVLHRSGHAKQYSLQGGIDAVGSQGKANKTAIQAVGSSVSYLRRYLTVMIFNLALTNDQDDDDGAPQSPQSQFISEAQENQILDMFAAANMSSERQRRFLEFFRISTLPELRVRDFDKAMKMLDQVARKVSS